MVVVAGDILQRLIPFCNGCSRVRSTKMMDGGLCLA